jgi:hypothetical protein
VKDPDEALTEARRRAAAQHAPGDDGAEWTLDNSTVPTRRLAAWAIIDPEAVELYSTRRFGGPLTALKRLLVRFLSQYFNQVTAQQSRFNAEVTAHLVRLDQRVRALEEQARRDKPSE